MQVQRERLGPGAMYHRSLDRLFRSHADLIAVAEIEPQTLWTKATRHGAVPHGNDAELQWLATLPQRRLMHGVGYPVGGTICDQTQHVDEFRHWAQALSSPWVSEHLSVLDVKGAHGITPSGFLMPPLQTDAGVRLAAENIVRRREALGIPFAFETGVNYFPPRKDEIPDGEFFAAVAESADSGILLDLTNLWVNDRNRRARIGDVLKMLPLERVWEVHLAGIEYAHGFWLDAHSCAIDRELIAIASEIMGSLPNLGTIIFEIAPDRISRFGPTLLLQEMECLLSLWEMRATPSTVPQRAFHPQTVVVPLPGGDPKAWEARIAQQMLPSAERPLQDAGESNENEEKSFALYRWLMGSFREGTVAELLANTTRLLLLALGEERLRELFARYIATTSPIVYPTDEALCFRRFLQEHPIAIESLNDVLAFESALVESAANNASTQIEVTQDIEALLQEIAAGRLPVAVPECSPMTVEVSMAPIPSVRVIESTAA
jgi:uncharacterized protein